MQPKAASRVRRSTAGGTLPCEDMSSHNLSSIGVRAEPRAGGLLTAFLLPWLAQMAELAENTVAAALCMNEGTRLASAREVAHGARCGAFRCSHCCRLRQRLGEAQDGGRWLPGRRRSRESGPRCDDLVRLRFVPGQRRCCDGHCKRCGRCGGRRPSGIHQLQPRGRSQARRATARGLEEVIERGGPPSGGVRLKQATRDRRSHPWWATEVNEPLPRGGRGRQAIAFREPRVGVCSNRHRGALRAALSWRTPYGSAPGAGGASWRPSHGLPASGHLLHGAERGGERGRHLRWGEADSSGGGRSEACL